MFDQLGGYAFGLFGMFWMALYAAYHLAIVYFLWKIAYELRLIRLK
jgi:hypothetical protein